MIDYGIKDACVVDARYFNRHMALLNVGDWLHIWAKNGEHADFCFSYEPIEDEV